MLRTMRKLFFNKAASLILKIFFQYNLLILVYRKIYVKVSYDIMKLTDNYYNTNHK
ncbi:unnamed protein product, partial [Schistosoma rodhaini]